MGQDGLVAKLAKYLSGQPVFGVTPDARAYENVRTTHGFASLDRLFLRHAAGDVDISARTMVKASVAGAGDLVALNEVFIGHRSHQSARYLVRFDGQEDFQSSSGVIFTTGSGLAGWAKSITTATHAPMSLGPTDATGTFLVREPWPSKHSGVQLRAGLVAEGAQVSLVSRINAGGVIFADGMEQDFLRFDWGTEVTLGVAAQRLNLVIYLQHSIGKPATTIAVWPLDGKALPVFVGHGVRRQKREVAHDKHPISPHRLIRHLPDLSPASVGRF